MDRLLPIKLSTPRPSHQPMHRGRVVELLSGALEARLVLLSAPPGFGKTSALIDWLTACPVRSSWISLDETDNDAVRFLRYLWAAAARFITDEAVTVAEAGLPDDPLEVADSIASLLAECREPSVVVLDDYHVITAPEVHRVVARLLERLPAQAHVVISTRSDPALPLARLRARGDLLEVRADALRFSRDETCEFFADRMRLSLSDADVDTLSSRTEGWPAVLQLAGLSLTGREDLAAHVRDFAATHRFVLDYVVEEVLAGLSIDTQDFLLRTSILERLSGALCDAITGGSDGQVRLTELDRDNLLIVPLDDERRWFRYHALFAEILRARLAALRPGDVAELHARASAWLEEHGDDDEAIRHALLSGDLERVSRIVAFASGRHLNAGELTTVRHWLDALPPDLIRGHAQLSASYAWCQIIAGEIDGVAERLADAERALAGGGDGGPLLAPAIPMQLALLRSQLAGAQGDVETAIAQARLAFELVPPGLPPEGEATLRGTAAALLALALVRTGETEAAATAYEASLPDLRAGGNLMALGRALADLAGIAIAGGDPARAVRLCESEIALGDGQVSAAGTASVWAALARGRAELGQPEAAEAAARRALAIGTVSGDTPSVRSAQATLARIAPKLQQSTIAASERARPAAVPGLVEALTPREIEVLRLVAVGRSNSQTAAELFVTVGTVKSHLHTISGKLGAANRVEAVARGRELGLLD